MTTTAGGTVEGALLDDVIDGLPGAELIYADWLEDQGRGEDARLWRSGPAGRVDALSPAQTRYLPVWRDAWLRIGLATGGYDRAEVEALIGDAYRVAGLEPPAICVHLDSPLRGAIGAAMFQVGGQVGGQVWDLVSGRVWGQVRDQVRGQVSGQVSGQVGGQVGGQVSDRVWGQVSGQVWGQVRDQVRGRVSGQIRDQVHRACYGSHDANWLSYYSYLLSPGHLDCRTRLLPLIRLARRVGWWWPLQDACVVTPRPSRLVMRRGELVEIEYPDGWGLRA